MTLLLYWFSIPQIKVKSSASSGRQSRCAFKLRCATSRYNRIERTIPHVLFIEGGVIVLGGSKVRTAADKLSGRVIHANGVSQRNQLALFNNYAVT